MSARVAGPEGPAFDRSLTPCPRVAGPEGPAFVERPETSVTVSDTRVAGPEGPAFVERLSLM